VNLAHLVVVVVCVCGGGGVVFVSSGSLCMTVVSYLLLRSICFMMLFPLT
jgi:hypothetical protein